MRGYILYLVSPFVDDRHVDVIHKHSHLATSRRAIGTAHTFVHIALYGALERVCTALRTLVHAV